MYICRLFHRDQPFEQIDARFLAEGRLSVGRDPSADWALDDPAGTLSRLHCVLAIEAGDLVLYDKSTNGVFLRGEERAPFDTPVVLADRDSIRLGALSILVERPQESAVEVTATTLLAPLWTGPTPVAAAWSEPEAPRPAHRDASLIEAFCDGARLDASALSSEDPADLMRRVGAIYQQTVLGLAALMADRAQLKRENEMKRTTISASDNNPFKWAPSRRLAEDLLCGRESAFLSDAAAVRACFEDLSRHLAGMMAGAEAAVAAVSTMLDPKAIEAEAKSQASLLRGRSAVAWDILSERHARVAERGARDAFAAAYEQPSVRAAAE